MSPDPAALRHHPLVYVDDLERPELTDDDHHHFARALRVATGAPIVVGDGAGRWRSARFDRRPEPLDEIQTQPPPPWPLTVGFAPVKGERPELIVQKLTELGIDEIVVAVTERSVVRWDTDRAEKMRRKLAIVAREACLQSRRLRLPTITGPVDLGVLLADRPGAVLADPDGAQPDAAHRVVVVGPEGGFTEGERRSAPAIRLPGHILRAGTAAIVAGTVIGGLRDA